MSKLFDVNMFWNVLGKVIKSVTKTTPPKQTLNVDYYRLAKTNSYSSARRELSKIKYIVVHYTGGTKDTARNNVDYFATGNTRYAGAHYFVDKTEICRSVDDNMIAWAVGGKGTPKNKVFNNNSISVELCSFKTYDAAVEAKAVECVRALMDIYGIDKSRVVRHYDVTSKKCPLPYVNEEELWRGFLSKL